MSRSDRLALLLSLVGVLAAYCVAERVFERVPHLEDEIAYVWQAKVIAAGQISISSPPYSNSFLIPFVVDYQGQRFGKYPPGWPAVLGLAVKLGWRDWINPLLAGLGLWLTYCLGKKIFSPGVGLLAIGLTLTSPFFLMNSGSLLSHPLGLVLSAIFVLGWLDAFGPDWVGRSGLPPLIPAAASALALGLLAVTRPLTAVGVALPFMVHGLYLLWRSNWATRRRLAGFVGLALCVSGLYFTWQYAVTGNALMNPYTLWWPYDQIGFGPGHGILRRGHSLGQGIYNTQENLLGGSYDLFGWGYITWFALLAGLWSARRNRRAWLVSGVFVSLVVMYVAYWIGATIFGPRYYYEGLYALTLISAAGIFWMADWPLTPNLPWPNASGLKRVRPLLVTAIVALLVGLNLVFYLPIRLSGMAGLYSISRANLEPFQTEAALAMPPALVFVHTDHWTPYGTLLELEDPGLSTPFVLAWSEGDQTDGRVAALFPERAVYHYCPVEFPGIFFRTACRQEKP